MAYGSILGKSTTTWSNNEILSSETAALFDLGSDAVPDDMLNALAHTGDLHVWKRTTITKDEIPAGYNLGAVNTGNFFLSTSSGSTYAQYSDTVTVSDSGSVSLVSPGSTPVDFVHTNISTLNILKGKFVTFSGDVSYFRTGEMYFIPSDAEFVSGNPFAVTKYQNVLGYAVTPPETSTDYPVSPNPNTYQEGTSGNTTIEYVGQLGDRVRVVTGNYVGTGTYGSSNPTVINYEKMPKVIIIQGTTSSQASAPCILLGGIVAGAWVGQDIVGHYVARASTGISGLAVNWAGDKVEFYNSDTSGLAPAAQCNSNGITYTYIMIF